MREREGSTIRAAVTTFVSCRDPCSGYGDVLLISLYNILRFCSFFFPLICWLSEENCYDDWRCVNKQIFIDEVAVIEFDLNL